VKEERLSKVTPYELDDVGSNPKEKDPWCFKPKEPKKSWGLCAQKKNSTKAQNKEDKLGVDGTTCNKKHS
jgi:hypothetical protein